MKKVLFLLAVSCIMLLTACGTTTVEEQNFDDTEEATEKHNTEKTAIDAVIPITILMPAEYVGSRTADDIADTYKEYGKIDVTVNPDGSVALSMTKAQQMAILEDFRKSTEESFSNYVNSDSYPSFISITASDDYMRYTVTTKSRKLEFGETMIEILFRMYGEYYSVFTGGNGDITGLVVEYKDQATGKVFKSTDPAFVPDNTPTPTPSPTNTPSPTPLLQVELIDEGIEVYKNYDDEMVCAYWAKYKNIGEGSIAIDDAGVDYYDNDGQWIGSDDFAWCIPEVVKPGEEFYVINSSYKFGSAYTNNGCIPKALFELKTAENNYSVDVLGVSFKKDDWYGIEITAKTKNKESGDYSYAKPYAVMFDASGKLVGYGMGDSTTFYADKEKRIIARKAILLTV